MYKFLSVLADKNTEKFINQQYFPQILSLFNRHKSVLVDDYYSNDNVRFILEIIDLVNRLYPHFYVIATENDEVMGFVYLDDWRGSEGKQHSCTITTCLDKKYWGQDSMNAGKEFISLIFKTYNLYKIKAEVFEHNHRVKNFLKSLGFKNEAVLKGETLKNGRPIDVVLYSRFRN